jgi:subtilase family serine protease
MGTTSRTLFDTRALLTLALAFAAAILALAPWLQPAAAPASLVRPVPFSTEHLTKQTLKTPPTTAFCVANFGVKCYSPAQFQKAYNLGPLYSEGFTGAGRTIVIVDSFGSPTIQNDLKVFDQTFGLVDPPSFTIITPAGAPPAFDPTDGDMANWAAETTLDVEYAHTIAPGANILLVETPVAETEGVQGFPEMMRSENFVVDHNLGDVISQSFGATEQTFPNKQSLLDLRFAFENANRHDVTVLASSGDTGAAGLELDGSCCFPSRAIIWPASDPLVSAVGGTFMNLDDSGNHLSPDVAANDGPNGIATGGGLSTVFDRPNFQGRVLNVVDDHRGMPDISMSGACDGLAVVYWSFPFVGTSAGYHLICGTSESAPLFSGVVAIADQMSHRRLGLLNQRLYTLLVSSHGNHSTGLVDVTQGNNNWTFCASACGTALEVDTTLAGFNAGPGYDLTTGVGTIDANAFVRALARGD